MICRPCVRSDAPRERVARDRAAERGARAAGPRARPRARVPRAAPAPRLRYATTYSFHFYWLCLCIYLANLLNLTVRALFC